MNDEEPVEKALMASSSVAVTSEDSANSNLVTLTAPANSLPGEVREPLSGGASTPLSGEHQRRVEGERRPKQRTFAGSRAGYSKNGGRYTQQQGPSTQHRHAACCRGADGRGYPLQGSTYAPTKTTTTLTTTSTITTTWLWWIVSSRVRCTSCDN